MSIRNLPLIQRKPSSNELDVKTTLQVFAEQLFAWADEEKKIKQSRKYRDAIRSTFTNFKAGTRIRVPVLVAMVLQKMRGVNPTNYGKLEKELELHIRLNSGVYLRTVTGRGGGVELLNKP